MARSDEGALVARVGGALAARRRRAVVEQRHAALLEEAPIEVGVELDAERARAGGPDGAWRADRRAARAVTTRTRSKHAYARGVTTPIVRRGTRRIPTMTLDPSSSATTAKQKRGRRRTTAPSHRRRAVAATGHTARLELETQSGGARRGPTTHLRTRRRQRSCCRRARSSARGSRRPPRRASGRRGRARPWAPRATARRASRGSGCRTTPTPPQHHTNAPRRDRRRSLG